MKSYKTPLRYPGGKSRAITKMEKYFPNLSTYDEFREPFLGGGSVSIYFSKKYPDLKIWVNDLYSPLYKFWKQLQSSGLEMQERLLELKGKHNNQETARELFLSMKEVLNDSATSDFDSAVAFYVVNKCSFSGLTESSSFSKQASVSNFSISGIEKLSGYSGIIKNWKITNLSYENLLEGSGAFVYLDPPYEIKDSLYGKKGNMHKHFDHDAFAEHCRNSNLDQLISYNVASSIRNRFDGWNSDTYELTYTMRSTGNYSQNQKDRDELLLYNYSLSAPKTLTFQSHSDIF